MTAIRVWDLPTRLFHWLLFACVVVAYFTAEGEGSTHQIHVAAGYGIGVLLLFRVIWGFAGTRYARFAAFGRALKELPGYLPKLLQLRPTAYLGHNPVGLLMIAAMTVTLVLVLWSGLYGGEELHETVGNLIIILAGIHVLGVVADSVMTGDNLVRAMVTGVKQRAEDPGEGASIPSLFGGVRALAVLAVTAVLTVLGFSQSQALKWPPPMESEMEEHDDGEHGEDGEHADGEEYEEYEDEYE